MYDTLKKMIKPFGVSGCETDIARVIEEEISKYTDEIRKDSMGNLIAVKYADIKGTEAPEKIMFAAHMDTVGIIVTHIDDKGYIRFSNLGGLRPYKCIGQNVEFSNGIKGVIYHDESIKDPKDIKISSLYVDTGITETEYLNKRLQPGIYGRLISPIYTQQDTIISGHLDDRAGCAILLETAKELYALSKAGEWKCGKEIYFTFTVQEELGLRGAGPAAFNINPDYAVVVDVTSAQDTPGIKFGNVFMGKGPVIKIKDEKIICHPYIREKLKSIAEDAGISYQLDITDRGGTDAGIIHMTRGGVVTGGISVAIRYIHTTVEMCSMEDVKNSVKILVKFVK